MNLTESILYKDVDSKIMFCYYDICEDEYNDTRLYYLSFIEGEIGGDYSFESQLSEKFDEIQELEKLLLDKYKLQVYPNTKVTIKISLDSNEIKGGNNIETFIKDITSGIKYICKTTGAGLVKLNFDSDIEISKTEITFKFDVVYHTNLEKYLIEDLKILGVNSSNINTTISKILYES